MTGVVKATRVRVRPAAGLAAILLPAVLAGCTGVAQLSDVLPQGMPARVELADTPFFPQQDHQCGPAALATVLAASGIQASPDELTREIYLPARHGTLQAELLGGIRRRGLLAYVMPDQGSAPLDEVAAGHPVLVLLNLGIKAYPIWHYAVVVGFDRSRDEVILRSGRTARATMSWWRFEGSWDRAGNWAVVVLEPGAMPAAPVALSYVSACAGLEAAGQLAPAGTCYDAASRRWPDDALAQLGRGNVAYAQRKLAAAVTAYRHAVTLAPTNGIARNNFAQALRDAGCRDAALSQVQRALKLLAGTPLEQDVRATQRAIEAEAPKGAADWCDPGDADL